MPSGYIKLWRVLLEKPIWIKSTSQQRSVLIALLLMANHKENEWEWKGQKFKVNPGQFVTSLESIRKMAGQDISIQNVRSSLTRFKKLQFLTYKSTKSGRIITILNWEQYQPKEYSGQQRRQQRGNKGATTNKNDKNDKNKNPVDFSALIYDFYLSEIHPEQKSRSRAIKNIKRWLKKHPYEDLIQAIKNYKIVCNGRSSKHCKDPANFFGVNEVFHIDYLPENFIQKENKCKTPTWF